MRNNEGKGRRQQGQTQEKDIPNGKNEMEKIRKSDKKDIKSEKKNNCKRINIDRKKTK